MMSVSLYRIPISWKLFHVPRFFARTDREIKKCKDEHLVNLLPLEGPPTIRLHLQVCLLINDLSSARLSVCLLSFVSVCVPGDCSLLRVCLCECLPVREQSERPCMQTETKIAVSLFPLSCRRQKNSQHKRCIQYLKHQTGPFFSD